MVKEDKVQVTVVVNGKQGISELGKLEMEANEVRFAMSELTRGTKKWVAESKKLNQIKTRIKGVRDELGVTGQTLTQLRRWQRELTREISTGTTRGTAAYKKLNAQLVKVNAAIARQRLEARGLGTVWASLKSSFSMFGPVALITSSIYALTRGIRSFISENISLSDSLADVRKNTELTKSEVDSLLVSLMKLNTRSSRKELLDMAIIAGKLGIRGVQDIEAFVSAADKINVALGEDLGDPTESLRTLGKLVNIFNLKKIYGLEDALIKTGSAVNDLGRASIAQEKNIIDFTNRMGAMADVTNVSIQEMMGMGAAGDMLGLSMDVMSTAMTQVMIRMVKNREVYARFAKDTEGNTISVAEFTELINTDFNTAMIAVLRGLKGNDKATTEFVDSLGEMGLEGKKVVQVVSALAMGVEDVIEQQNIANRSFKEGTSVLEEFDLKNQTAGANFSKVWKAFSTWFVNSGVMRGFESLAGWMAKIVEIRLSKKLEDERLELNTLVWAIKGANTNFEIRNQLIDELISKYPNFLGNIKSEAVSNELLSLRLKEVNEQYLKKIIMQSAEEEIKELLTEQIDLMDKRIEMEKKLANLRQAPARGASPDVQAILAYENTIIPGLDRQMVQIDKKIEEIEEKKNSLFSAFSLDDFFKTKTGETANKGSSPSDIEGGSGGGGLTDKQITDYQKYVDQLQKMRADLDIYLLDSDQQEIARVERKYAELINEANAFYADGVSTKEDHDSQITALNSAMEDELVKIFDESNAKHRAARQKIREEIDLELIGDQEKEIAQVTAYFDRLIANGEREKELEKEKQAAIDGIKDHYRQIDLDKEKAALDEKRALQVALGNNIASSLQAVASLQADQTVRGIQNQKDLANAAIIASNAVVVANQAAALSDAIKIATSGATAAGPAGPLVLIGLIAAMTATVLGAFAGIHRNNQNAKAATSALNKKEGRGYYHGGYTGNSTLGYGDQDGDYAGYVHKNEQVLSKKQLQTPTLVMPAYKSHPPAVIDLGAINSTVQSGGRFSDATTTDTSGMEAVAERMEQAALTQLRAAEQMSAVYNVLFENGLTAQLTDDILRKGDERLSKFKATGTRGKISG